MSRNQRSITFSHELLVGMKWMWNRGWRLSQALTWECFVCGVVIDDQMQVQFRGRFGVDLLEELDPRLMAVPGHAFGDDLPFRQLDGCKQSRPARPPQPGQSSPAEPPRGCAPPARPLTSLERSMSVNSIFTATRMTLILPPRGSGASHQR